jgi:hypothetical protein
MSKKTNGVNYSMKMPIRSRRQSALNLLQNQLTSGLKPKRDENNKTSLTETVPLEQKDIERIKKEMLLLKSRI